MFAQYYRLSAAPFQLTPDRRFFFGSSVHSRAIAHLVYGVAQEEGFVIVTGEVGAGKTTLVEQLWSQVPRDRFVVAQIVTSQVSGDDLLRLAAAGFGAAPGPDKANGRDGDKAALLRGLEAALRGHHAAGRRCLLVVDEVQALSLPALEELRMLSNVTIDGRASLQTILLGQPQFRRMLARPDLEQLRQRVVAAYHLGPMTEAETRAYVEHRLRTVGWDGGNPGWEDAAFAAVHRHSGGIPRRINTLCSRVLLYGALDEQSLVTEAMVEHTAGELQGDLESVQDGDHLPAAAAYGNGADQAAGAQDMGPQDMGPETLGPRVHALEQAVTRQERVFRRLAELLDNHLGSRP
jgi:putative secretion ATPase (PEP-CTERM system associated)